MSIWNFASGEKVSFSFSLSVTNRPASSLSARSIRLISRDSLFVPSVSLSLSDSARLIRRNVEGLSLAQSKNHRLKGRERKSQRFLKLCSLVKVLKTSNR